MNAASMIKTVSRAPFAIVFSDDCPTWVKVLRQLQRNAMEAEKQVIEDKIPGSDLSLGRSHSPHPILTGSYDERLTSNVSFLEHDF